MRVLVRRGSTCHLPTYSRVLLFDGLHATGIEPVGLTLLRTGAETPVNEESKHLKSTTHQALLGEVGGWTSESDMETAATYRSIDRPLFWVRR